MVSKILPISPHLSENQGEALRASILPLESALGAGFLGILLVNIIHCQANIFKISACFIYIYIPHLFKKKKKKRKKGLSVLLPGMTGEDSGFAQL